MYKILYIISTLRHTGPVIQLFNICNHLNRKIFLPEILTLSPEPVDSIKKIFEEINIPIVELNNSRLSGIFKNTIQIKKIIRKLKPDIIHTHAIRADVIIHSLKFKNHVSTIHIYAPEDYRMKYGKWTGAIMSRKHIKIFKSMKYALACSEELANRLKELGLVLSFVNNGVDEGKYKNTGNVFKKQLRRKLNIDEKSKIFLSASELNERKNVKLLIDCFNKISNSDEKLIILGSGPEEIPLKNLAKGNQNITFIGKVNNVNEYYNAADFFISGSFSEGMSMSVLEAMSSGLPVLLSDIPSHRSVFNNKDNYIYFFSPFEINNLMECIKKIEMDNYEQLSSQMRKIVLDNYTAKKMSQNYQKIYKKIIRDEIN